MIKKDMIIDMLKENLVKFIECENDYLKFFYVGKIGAYINVLDIPYHLDIDSSVEDAKSILKCL